MAHWDIVIGLEVHLQLATQSKLFSSASTAFGAKPNAQASFVDLALPGILPTLNQEAVNMAILFGLSINASINQDTIFSRKNYFYPDLPKGYQITQDAHPIIKQGVLDISMAYGAPMTVEIVRAHLEEDAGQSSHDSQQAGLSAINLNRAGIPLLEVVTAPVMHSSAEAVAFLKSIRTLARYLNISTGNMQEGAMRCDANVSVRKSQETPLGTRVEIKNINSFKFVERAIEYEVQRQIETLESGGTVQQETRLYDSKNNLTQSMRSKENALDYRYFPDPDLPHVRIHNDEIKALEATLPELPQAKCDRFLNRYELRTEEAHRLCIDPDFSDFFEQCVAQTCATPQTVANWLCGEYLNLLKQKELTHHHTPITSDTFATLLDQIEKNMISGAAGKAILAQLFNSTQGVIELIESMGLAQISDTETLSAMIQTVLDNNPSQLEAYQAGKDKLFGYFVGQVMKASKGRANPNQVNTLLHKMLSKKSTP